MKMEMLFLDSAFHDLVEVFRFRDPSSMLLGRLFVGGGDSLVADGDQERDNSDAKSFVV